MKTFKEYLAEGKKTYNFKIKIAGDLPESFQNNLKASLDRCKVIKLEKTGTTPIQSSPLDFPTKENCEVHMFEVICEYPITSPEISVDVKAAGITEDCFRVQGSDEIIETETAEVVNVKHKDYFGDDFNKGFLKDLSKTAKDRKKEGVQTEYKLPKAKIYKTGAKSALGS
jgi:hypothetical protein